MEIFHTILNNISRLFQWWIIIMPWEEGLRIRFGKKVKRLYKGIHFRIPFFDAIYCQTTRLRVISFPPQTVTTKDNHTITILIAAGYIITDIEKLYNSLYQPEITLSNMIMGSIGQYIINNNLTECDPASFQKMLEQDLNKEEKYGIKIEYVKIIGYAIVRTFRLIQDNHWISDNLDVTRKKGEFN